MSCEEPPSQGGTDRERGAVIVIFALAMTALLIIAALVVDVGYAYGVGRQEQTVADMSALAAARYLPGKPVTACTSGWDYVTANLIGLSSGATSPGGSFPSTCDPSSPGTDYTATSTGSYTITFRYPVADGTSDGLSSTDVDPLLGSPRVDDGTDPCSRFGVVITHKDASFFSAVGGISSLNPRADAVALESTGTELTKVANLVSLDPRGCTGISVSGTGTAVLVGTAALPGAIAVDSDGSACTGQQTTVSSSASSGSAYLYACPNPLSHNSWCPTSSSNGPGQILLYSLPGVSTSCSVPACSSADYTGNRLGPQPISNSERVTRAPVDYTYNCESSYPTLYDGVVSISPCYTGSPPYITNLISQVQSDATSPTTAGFSVIDKSGANGGCSPNTAEVLTGNFWVNCDNFTVQGASVTFRGNVVFSHLAGTAKSTNVGVSGGGSLTFEGNPTGTLDAGCLSAICLNESSPSAAYVYVNGNFGSTGQNSSVAFQNTAVYVSAYQSTDVESDPTNFGCSTSGTANYVSSASGATQSWSAPTQGPLANLALWSEGASNKFQLTGGGNSSIAGVFFTPCASPFSISGGFTNPQDAQFLSFQLAVSGGGVVEMVPDPTKMIKTAPTGAELIR